MFYVRNLMDVMSIHLRADKENTGEIMYSIRVEIDSSSSKATRKLQCTGSRNPRSLVLPCLFRLSTGANNPISERKLQQMS
jgi:hypothetical protein